LIHNTTQKESAQK